MTNLCPSCKHLDHPRSRCIRYGISNPHRHSCGGFEEFLSRDHADGAFIEESPRPEAYRDNPYAVELRPGVYADLYDMMRALKITDPAHAQAFEKIARLGRMDKDIETDARECKKAIDRYVDYMKDKR